MPCGFTFRSQLDPIPLKKNVSWPNFYHDIYSIEKFGIGKGEFAIAAVLLNIDISDPNSSQLMTFLRSFVSGQNESFDIEITQKRIDAVKAMFPDETKEWIVHTDFGKVEVKKQQGKSTIRLGSEGANAVLPHYPFFRELALEIKSAFFPLRETFELILPSELYSQLETFVVGSDGRPSSVFDIDRGVMSNGRAIGSSHQEMGLYQIVKLLHDVKCAKLNLPGKTWKIRIVDTKLFITLTPRKMVNVLKSSELVEEKMSHFLRQLELNELQVSLLRFLSHPAFDNPEIVLEKFSAMAPPAEALKSIDTLALVSENGFRLIPHRELNIFLSINSVVQGVRPCYHVIGSWDE